MRSSGASPAFLFSPQRSRADRSPISIKKLAVCCLFLLTCASAEVQRTVAHPLAAREQKALVRDAVFHSSSLERDMRYRVLLPRSYENGGRFPVLYLLHGIYGDYKNWDTRTGLENYAKDLHIIIVMPDADDSWYTNSATVAADKFEDYIAKDLIAEIDEKYRTIHDGHRRAIAGLSMGGYGAVKLGVKYPDLFAFAGSLSGAFNAPNNLDTLRPDFRTKLLEVFGGEGGHTRPQNDIFLLLNTRHQAPYPYFYLACGTADFFLDTNRSLTQQLSSRNLAYEYHETPGGHTWEYWDQALQPLLGAVGDKLRNQPSIAGEQ
jgi:S-formylglutathione hydrolase FrmB